MTLKNKKKWRKLLKPYWNSFKIINTEFHKNIHCLEDRMKKELGEDLEFFHSDDGFCGIGHSDYSRRKKGKNYFPLFQAEDLGGY